MPTSSITKRFIVSGTRQAEIFANAVEESANSERKPFTVNVVEVHSLEEARNYFANLKKVNE